MTDQTAQDMRTTVRGGALYRLIWKWHFIASLIVLPFMMMMAITGGIYLFHDSIDEMLHKEMLHVTPSNAVQPYESLAPLAQAAGSEVLGAPSRIHTVFVSDDPTRSMIFEIEDPTRVREFEDQAMPRAVVWVNQYSGEVIGAVHKGSQFIHIVEGLHTHLLAGQFGEYVVEALACWAFVMFVTGLYLWWPRGTRGWRDVFKLPKGSGRGFWRSTHIWIGFFASLIIIPLILSGMFWTDVWGKQYLNLQLRMKHFSPILAYGGPPVFAQTKEGAMMPMDDLIAKARQAGITGELEFRPPVAPKFGMLMRTEESLPMRDQIEIHVDLRSGEILRAAGYEKAPAMAYYRSAAARLHLGMLYGDLNWYQNFIGVILTLVLSVSGFVAWWKRRPAGELGVPAAPVNPRLAYGLVILIVALGIFFPLMGATLIAALILDRLIFQRIGWFQPANR